MASKRCLHLWLRREQMNHRWQNSCYRIQNMNRTLSSLQVAVRIHSSSQQFTPRGVIAPFGRAGKLKDENFEMHESDLMKDTGLADTYIVGRKSNFSSFNKDISASKRKDLDDLKVDELFKDDDVGNEDHPYEKTFLLPRGSKKSEWKNDFRNFRSKIQHDLDSQDEEPRISGRDRQQFVDRGWFKGNEDNARTVRTDPTLADSAGARTSTSRRIILSKPSSRYSNFSDTEDMMGKKICREERRHNRKETDDKDGGDTSMRRITAPKVSNYFQYTDEDLLAVDGESKRGSRSDRQESRRGNGENQRNKFDRNKTRNSKKNVKNERGRKSELQNIPADHEILYGIAPCLLALERGKREMHQAFISPSFQESTRDEVQTILAALEKHEKQVHVVHRNELDRISRGHTHQGICLETSPLESFILSDREEVLTAQLETFKPADSQQQCVMLALDQVKDPMNFGAVLRSSYFLGVERVITCINNSCPLTPVVSKASSGVMEVHDIYETHNMPTFLEHMSSLGWLVLGACSETYAAKREAIECIPCQQFTLEQPTILVVGNEGYGMRSKVEEKCSKLITINPGRELHPGIDSLNVSVATGILLHSMLRR